MPKSLIATVATVYELTKRATLLSKEVSGAAINTHGIPLQMLRTRRKACYVRAVMCYGCLHFKPKACLLRKCKKHMHTWSWTA